MCNYIMGCTYTHTQTHVWMIICKCFPPFVSLEGCFYLYDLLYGFTLYFTILSNCSVACGSTKISHVCNKHMILPLIIQNFVQMYWYITHLCRHPSSIVVLSQNYVYDEITLTFFTCIRILKELSEERGVCVFSLKHFIVAIFS